MSRRKTCGEVLVVDEAALWGVMLAVGPVVPASVAARLVGVTDGAIRDRLRRRTLTRYKVNGAVWVALAEVHSYQAGLVVRWMRLRLNRSRKEKHGVPLVKLGSARGGGAGIRPDMADGIPGRVWRLGDPVSVGRAS